MQENANTIPAKIIEIVYSSGNTEAENPELTLGVLVDKAHLIMACEQNIIAKDVVKQLIGQISKLEVSGFNEISNFPMPRGLYIAYEDFLRGKLGDDIVGWLHTGRSRNDLFATIFRLKTRQLYRTMMPNLFALNRKIITLSDLYKDTACVLHTQLQPAMFGTYGHFFCGVAEALTLHTEQILYAYNTNDYNPLGSGAVSGTSHPISTQRTTELLGFRAAVANSITGVAHYEYVINLTASLVSYGAILNRLMSNLHIWASPEFGFVKFKSESTGRSSMLPQKKNPFLLEVINARLSSLTSSLTYMASGFKNVPFSNAIEAKSVAKKLWDVISDFDDTLQLASYIFDVVELETDMARRDIYRNCNALYLAEKMSKEHRIPYRDAYNIVTDNISDNYRTLSSDEITYIIESFEYGHGPNRLKTEEAIKKIKSQLCLLEKKWDVNENFWKNAEESFHKETSLYL